MPQVKDRGEAATGQLEGVITMRSNPIPTRWVTHKLENNNTKIVPPLLWRFSVPGQASQPGDPAKRLGIPRESEFEGQQDLIIGLPQDWGKQTPLLEGTNKMLHAAVPRGKEQWHHRRLNQTYLLVLEGLLWRCGSAVALCGDENHWQQNSWDMPLAVSPLEGHH